MNVLHLTHRLTEQPVPMAPAKVMIRTFTPEDVPGWLALRERAFAEETPSLRLWTEVDFDREMSGKPWWRNEYTWLATLTARPDDLIGAVTLAMRKDAAVVHWLMVDPSWRRQRIGRALMAHLEETAWRSGKREVVLETHQNWQAAVELYRSIGYLDEII